MKLSKIKGHSSFMEKKENEIKLHSNKQPVKEILIERAVKTTKQIFYD